MHAVSLCGRPIMQRLKSTWRYFWLRWHGIRAEMSCPGIDMGIAKGSWKVSPDTLNTQSIIYSFGIGTDISFDLALIARFHSRVHAFDPTPRSRAWIKSQSMPEFFVYHDFGIASYDGMMLFHAPKNPASAHFSPVPRYRRGGFDQNVSAPAQTLQTIMASMGHDHLDLLKLDIEGGEYEVIKNILEDQIPIRQLLVEFHHNYRTIHFNQTVQALRHLGKAGFRIFNVSRRALEFSLLRVA